MQSYIYTKINSNPNKEEKILYARNVLVYSSDIYTSSLSEVVGALYTFCPSTSICSVIRNAGALCAVGGDKDDDVDGHSLIIRNTLLAAML